MMFAAVYVLVVGTAMLGMWSYSLLKGQVPELRTEPLRILFHLAGECITAAALLAAGIGLLLDTCWAFEAYLISIGMLFYTVIVSPGYFAQKGQWAMVGFFALLLALGLVGLALIL